MGAFGTALSVLLFNQLLKDGTIIFARNSAGTLSRVAAGGGIEHALGTPVSVAQIHEDQSTMVTPPEGPAHERHALANVLGT